MLCLNELIFCPYFRHEIELFPDFETIKCKFSKCGFRETCVNRVLKNWKKKIWNGGLMEQGGLNHCTCLYGPCTGVSPGVSYMWVADVISRTVPLEWRCRYSSHEVIIDSIIARTGDHVTGWVMIISLLDESKKQYKKTKGEASNSFREIWTRSYISHSKD